MLIDAHQAGLRIGETRIHCRYDVDGSTMGSFRHASGVLGELLFQVGVAHPLLYLALPGLILALGGVAAAIWATYLDAVTGSPPVGWLLVSLSLTLMGMMGMFTGVLFNLLPGSIAHALRRLLPKGD